VAWAAAEIGPLGALVVAHTHSGLGGVLDTDVAEWDRHPEVNARGAFGLCAAFARRWSGVPGSGRIVVYTSVHRLPARSPMQRARARSNGWC
jgi:3-oxoacyl-[acyl-carrier protein] reductase